MTSPKNMRANVFRAVNKFGIEDVERPSAGVGEAVIRVSLTTICGTDLHIVRGEYPVKPGLIIGHEPVGVIEELGAGVTGYGPVELSPASVCTPASFKFHTTPSRPVWATIASSPRFARVEKSGCAG